MRTVLYTRCVDTRFSSNNPFPPQKAKSYYCPTLYESYRSFQLMPGEHCLICMEEGDVLHAYHGDCCCGGCVSEWSSQILTIEVWNTHLTRTMIMGSKMLLTTLLDHPDIDYHQTVAKMSDIDCSKYDQWEVSEESSALSDPPPLNTVMNAFEINEPVKKTAPVDMLLKRTLRWNDLCYHPE